MSTDSTLPKLNLDSLKLACACRPEGFRSRHAAVAAPLGLRKLGARLTELPPGQRGFPPHHHYANDELFVVLEGAGTFLLGEARIPVGAGDIVAAPAGGPESAHGFVNTSDAPLRYLAVSTMVEPDVVGYPQSGKFAVFAGAAPGGPRDARRFEHVGRIEDAVGYWDGE